jgi:hypothetical protein
MIIALELVLPLNSKYYKNQPLSALGLDNGFYSFKHDDEEWLKAYLEQRLLKGCKKRVS